MEDTRLTLERAAEGMEGREKVRQAMANAYTQLISKNPETLQMQMQGYAVVAAAEAHGDEQFGEIVRAGWMRLWDTVHLSLGADANETTAFLAHGTLINALTAIRLPPITEK